MRIQTLVTVPSPGKRGRLAVGGSDRRWLAKAIGAGLGQTDSRGPPGRSDTYGLPGGVPVGLVADVSEPPTGIGRSGGR